MAKRRRTLPCSITNYKWYTRYSQHRTISDCISQNVFYIIKALGHPQSFPYVQYDAANVSCSLGPTGPDKAKAKNGKIIAQTYQGGTTICVCQTLRHERADTELERNHSHNKSDVHVSSRSLLCSTYVQNK